MSNKVKPQAGMEFKLLTYVSGFEVGDICVVVRDGASMTDLNRVGDGKVISCGINKFHSEFEFAPQNDLEWLAVNFGTWIFKDDLNISRKVPSPMGYVVGYSCKFTKQQWQECRYKLGLDERPENKKMINMSKHKISDEFKYCGEIVTLGYVSKSGTRFVLDSRSGGVIVCDEKGRGCTSEEFQLLPYDPRPWLKDLPAAGLFAKEVEAIFCPVEGDDWWYSFAGDCNDQRWLPMAGMPKLSESDCEQSKISIADLAKWQSENK